LSRNVLEFRRGSFVLLAYVAAPAAAMSLLWLVFSIWEGIAGSYTIREDLNALPFLVIGGGVAGMIAELLFVTPVLLVMRRYRWSWINTWWFAAYGVFVGEVCNLFLSSVLSGHESGWRSALQGISVFGLVGLTAGIVFYRIAFQRPVPSESASPLGR
jgi:hypothetical protein